MTSAEPLPVTCQSLAETVAVAARLGDGTTGIVGLDGTLTPWSDVLSEIVDLARGLRAAGVEPGDRVVVAHLKSHQSFVAAHAVLQAAAIFVPVDPLTSRATR